jgi:hypothetical protein
MMHFCSPFTAWRYFVLDDRELVACCYVVAGMPMFYFRDAPARLTRITPRRHTAAGPGTGVAPEISRSLLGTPGVVAAVKLVQGLLLIELYVSLSSFNEA